MCHLLTSPSLVVFVTPCGISCTQPFHGESRQDLSSIHCNMKRFFQRGGSVPGEGPTQMFLRFPLWFSRAPKVVPKGPNAQPQHTQSRHTAQARTAHPTPSPDTPSVVTGEVFHWCYNYLINRHFRTKRETFFSPKFTGNSGRLDKSVALCGCVSETPTV